MALISQYPPAGGPVRTNLKCSVYLIHFSFSANGTGISATSPANGITVVHGGSAGVYTATFAAKSKPKNILWGDAEIMSTGAADEDCRIVSYVASTGVLTINYMEESAGTMALANTPAARTISVCCLASDSDLSD